MKTDDTPNVDQTHLQTLNVDRLALQDEPNHPVRVMMLYGSLRKRSYSKLLTDEAARILRQFGADVRIFDPAQLPLVDESNDTHPKVQELRKLSLWSEAHVWCSPERHGAMTGVMKTQIDWLPLAPIGGVRDRKSVV